MAVLSQVITIVASDSDEFVLLMEKASTWVAEMEANPESFTLVLTVTDEPFNLST